MSECLLVNHNVGPTVPLVFQGTTPDGWHRWSLPTWTERLPRRTKKAVRKFFGGHLTRNESRRVWRAIARLPINSR